MKIMKQMAARIDKFLDWQPLIEPCIQNLHVVHPSKKNTAWLLPKSAN